MVDDIQLLVIQDDEEETDSEAPTPEPRESALPNAGVREGLALLVAAGLLLIGIGVLGGPTGENASLLWLFGSLQLFNRSSEDERADASESAAATGEVSLTEVEAAETRKASGDASTESPAVTRNRPEMSVAETDGNREVAALVKTLMREGKQQPLPDASGIVAPIRRPLAATLEGIPQELTVLRRDVGPVLVGIAYNETTVSRLAEVYDTMLVVAPHHEDSLEEVLKYLPALIQTNGVNGLGSARTFTIPAPEPPGPETESQATLKDLRGHKGEPLHPLARTEPDFLTMSAPPEWTGPARSVLSDYAPVIDIIEWDAPEIHVAGFVFDSAIELPDHIVEQASTNAEDGRARPEGNENAPSRGTFTAGSIDSSEQPETDGGEARSRSGSSTAAGTVAPESASQGPTPVDDSSVPIPSEQCGGDSDTDPDSDAERSNDDAKVASSGTDEGQERGPGDRSGSAEKPEMDSTSGTSTGDRQSGGKSTTDDRRSDSPSPDHTRPPEDDREQAASRPPGMAPENKRGGDNGSEPSAATSQPEEDNGPAGDTGPPTTEAGNPGDQEQSSDRADDSPADAPGNLPPADANIDFGTDTGDSDGPSRETATGTPAESASGKSPSDDRPSSTGDDESPDAGSTGAAPGPDPGAAPTGDSGADGSGQAPSQQPTPASRPASRGDDRSEPPGEPKPSQPVSGRPESRSRSGRPTRGGANTGPVAGGAPTGGPSGTSSTDSTGSSGPPTPPYGTDDGPGIVPFGEAPASSDPTVVDVTEHVLNELTFQATATPDREVYATVYADEDGLIRHHHAIDHPDFLESRRDSITFTAGFFNHLRLLANLRKDIDHRLAGGAHSHPVSGRPKQSPADKQFAQKVWRNQRNTAFVIGVNEGTGPDEWTITDDGYEVQRQSNEYLVRIRAFAGTNESKQIRLHQDMGQ